MKLKGKVAIVTGARRGIGRATALELAKEGANIVVNYRDKKIDAEKVVNEIKKIGSCAIAIKADVSKEKEVQLLVDETLSIFKRIDILVNNAGVAEYTDSLSFDETTWNKIMDTNIKGVVNCIQKCAKIMLEQKTGTIVNVSSISGTTNFNWSLYYEISKSTVNTITKHFAIKLGPDIKVNCVAPGGTDTDMAKNHSKKNIQDYIEKAPLKRRAKPEDIAKNILFLCSDDSINITGQTIVSDGGYTL